MKKKVLVVCGCVCLDITNRFVYLKHILKNVEEFCAFITVRPHCYADLSGGRRLPPVQWQTVTVVFPCARTAVLTLQLQRGLLIVSSFHVAKHGGPFSGGGG